MVCTLRSNKQRIRRAAPPNLLVCLLALHARNLQPDPSCSHVPVLWCLPCSLLLLQLAASDAAIHGWPPSTLTPLLQCMAGSYHQELISLLAKPLVLALQQRRQEVVESLLDVLVREAALDQGDMLADALLLLAYQVGVLCCDVLCCGSRL